MNFLKRLFRRKKEVVFTFGKFYPPHIGHEKLFNTMKNLAAQRKCKVEVWVSPKTIKNINVDVVDRVKLLLNLFPFIDVWGASKPTPFDVLEYYSREGYTHVTMIVGSDRVLEFRERVAPYLNNPKKKEHNLKFSFEVVNAGNRNDLEGISSSKMREFVINNDMVSFMKNIPSTMSIEKGKKLYKFLRKELQDL